MQLRLNLPFQKDPPVVNEELQEEKDVKLLDSGECLT